MLEAPAHAVLRDFLEHRTRLWRKPVDVVFETAPPAATLQWHPSAAVVVVTDDLAIAGNVVTGARGWDHGIVIFLGKLAARNLLNLPDTEVYCAGPCTVPGLVFAATPDSTFVVCGALEVGIAYSGRSHGYLTALGSTEIEVLDDYVAGPDDDSEISARRPEVSAADSVIADLAGADGGLDLEAALALFGKSTTLTL